ncbi:general transcription factor II-I repeat domain-containing protein 2A [Trichonephila clavipes]|nr:general transcription factor II-I repeat domain-containing protein 2A [Trichonephila clavipes]
MINKGDKAVCVLCSGTVVCRTSSVKPHFETNHKSFCGKSEPEQKELIASTIKDRNKQSTSMFKYVSKNCHTSAASYSAANAIVRHGKPFQEREFLKEAWLACAPSLSDDFDNKAKIIQRIKDVPLSSNTMKDRILKLEKNVTDQQKNDINSAPFISLCLDESIDITKSARLAVFAQYCVGNIIKEELIAITSLLTTTEGKDICTAVRNSLAEKEIDLKKIVSVTTNSTPNMKLLGAVDTRRYPRAENRVWRKTTRREDRRIVRQALVDPTVTRSTIRADVGVAIVPQTISRHLAEANLKSKRPFRAFPLTPEHRQLRLQWSQARSMWNVTDWQKVVFSDESRFVLGTDDNRVRVWRRPGEWYNFPHTVLRHTARTAGVMVWGCHSL